MLFWREWWMVELLLVVLGVGIMFLGNVEGLVVEEGRMDAAVCLMVVLFFVITILLAEIAVWIRDVYRSRK